ncbi:MAG: hypothetical protein ACRC78_23245 [Planktothrix sp.]
MAPLVAKRTARAMSRIFDFDSFTPEEINRRESEKKELDQRCYKHFEKIRNRLLETHYNWCVAIEPESGYYLLDSNWERLVWRVKIYCPKSQLMLYGINETGTCGQI